MSISCETLEGLLPEFMDGDLPEDVLADALDHVATCDSCRIVVDELHKVGELYREHGRLQLPDETRKRIAEFLNLD